MATQNAHTKKTPVFFTGYNTAPRSPAPVPPPGEPARTKQSFKAECDINNILKKYQKTGAITHANNHAAQYGFAPGETFHESMNIVLKAQAMFADLPSTLRNRFNGDPGAFLDFVQDESNAAEMAELGLIPSPADNGLEEAAKPASTASEEAGVQLSS